jgi:hypothetical protein
VRELPRPEAPEPVGISECEAEDRLLLAKVVKRPLIYVDFGGGKRGRLAVNARRSGQRDCLGVVAVEMYLVALIQLDRLNGHQHAGGGAAPDVPSAISISARATGWPSDTLAASMWQHSTQAIGGKPRNRSSLAGRGKPTYIITVPEKNHESIRRPTAIPR